MYLAVHMVGGMLRDAAEVRFVSTGVEIFSGFIDAAP